MERKGVGLAVPTSMLRGDREIEHKKPKEARLGEEPIDNVCTEESQVFSILGEENKYKSRDAESYKQDASVDASQGIEGNHGYAQLKSIKDYS
ncbi:hypothetical protein NL676_005238 [Syzygium grande]|nr:hypothetical protein NL676_005238 [Syzygium grande]